MIGDNKKFSDLIVYQIYPRSFYDSNKDGIGDIKGIITKLDYLCDLGINAIWICPIYKSPQCDNGYDISDYRDIEPDFGTIDDFDNLLEEAHKRNIKVIMDLVANHTSDKHKWFQEARKSKDNPYHDYYYFRDKPLNEWESYFSGSAWEYNKETNEYYLHSFGIGQPDLDWNNEKVRKEFQDIVDFWADKGVDGFRCDVIDFIAKDFENNKMFSGPKIHEYLKELFGRKKVEGLFTVGECNSDVDSIKYICGEDRDELKCVFQFDHIGIGRKDKYTPCEHSLYEVKKVFTKWQDFTIRNNLIYTLLTDNHDQPWYNSRVGNDNSLRYESATCLATMFYLLRGIPFIYQGQEIGSANSNYKDISFFSDIETVNYYKENSNDKDIIKKINYGSRDNTRRPMAWNNTSGYGFTEGDAPWLPYASRSREINVKNDIESKKSIHEYYKKILSLRKQYEVIRYGNFVDLSIDEKYFAFKRTYNNEEILVICNYEKESEVKGLSENYKMILSNTGSYNEVNRTYKPYETAVYIKK